MLLTLFLKIKESIVIKRKLFLILQEINFGAILSPKKILLWNFASCLNIQRGAPPFFVVRRWFFLCVCLVMGLFRAKMDHFCEAVLKMCIIHRLWNPSKCLTARIMIGWPAVTRSLSTQLSLENKDSWILFSICTDICWPVGFQLLLAWWLEGGLIFYKYNRYFQLWLRNSTFAFLHCHYWRYL
jgi:hypothetical protein